MAKYSEEFKLSIIKQMMPPQNKTVSILSKKNGIAEQTFSSGNAKQRPKVLKLLMEKLKVKNGALMTIS